MDIRTKGTVEMIDPRKDGLFEKIRSKTITVRGLHTSSGQVTVKVWLPRN